MTTTICYVSHEYGTDVNPLIKTLNELGVRVIRLDAEVGAPLQETLEQEVQRCTFVCAVLSERPSPWVLFEMGLARGLGKPVIVITSNPSSLPFSLGAFPTITGTPNETEAIRFNIGQFLEHVTRPGKKAAPFRTTTYDNSSSITSPQATRIANSDLDAYELELELVSLFKSIKGVSVHHIGGTKDGGADMALWIDGLEHTVGCPILVEVKKGIRSSEQLISAEQQLIGHLAKASASVGILLYTSSLTHLPHTERFPVLRFSVDELLNLMVSKSLASVIVERRNALVHGGKK